MCRSSVLFVALVLMGATSLVPAARADTPTPASEQIAEDGYKLRVESRDAEALEKFQAAYQLRAAPRYLAQIALAEQALGRWALAHEHLTEALRDQNDPWIKKWNADLQATLATMKDELATLEVSCNVPGTVIVIAEREVGRTPLAAPLYVSPGTIAIDLRAEGYLPVSHVVKTERRQLSRLDVTLIARSHPGASEAAGPAVADAPTAAPPVEMYQVAPQVEAQSTPRPSVDSTAAAPALTVTDATAASDASHLRDRRWLYYGAGAGAAVALIGGITYAVAGNKAESLENDCYDQACDADERQARRQNVRALDRASWALLPLGIATVLGSGAAYYWWTAPAPERRAKTLQVNATGDASRVMVHGRVEF